MSIRVETFIVLLFATIGLAACDDGKGPGNPDAYQDASRGGVAGACSSTFISDYNEVMRAAQNAAMALSDELFRNYAQSARDKAVQFKSRYSGVYCSAETKREDTLGYQTSSIDASAKMDELIAAIDRAVQSLDASKSTGTGYTKSAHQEEVPSSVQVDALSARTPMY